MMVKWVNDGLLQANEGKMLVNEGKMLVNDGEMSAWSYTHLTIIDEHLPSLLAWSKPSFAHLTIIEKLHRLKWLVTQKLIFFVGFPPSVQDFFFWFIKMIHFKL